ncbi:hypothetical protein [Schlesneria sp. T3-172]|uniref:hypothetical protein n=1 Tax=Schlesneria sphaerica TaxID=3373610 RepID=UPI0037C89A40
MPTRLLEILIASTAGMNASGVLLRVVLAALSIFATVHLFSLWGTRYGDQNTLGKSLFLSLVLHACFCMGWVTVADSYPKTPTKRQGDTVQTPITFIDADDAARDEGTNPLPIFNQGVSTQDPLIARDPRTMSRVERDELAAEIESPELDKAPETVIAPEIPDFTAFTEESAPGLEQSSASPPAAAAASSEFMLDEPTSESRPEATSSASTRTSISRSPAASEGLTRPAFQRTAPSRGGSLPEDVSSMTLPSDINPDSMPAPPVMADSDTIQRSNLPSPAELQDLEMSSAEDPFTAPAPAATRRTERNSRPATRPEADPDEPISRPTVASNAARTGRLPDDRMLNGRSLSSPLDDSPQPAFVRPSAPASMRAPARAAETYQARTSVQRKANVIKHGGTEESEKAVENSLKWFASIQEADGRWSSARHGGGSVKFDPQGQDRQDGGKFADSGVTGLVVLSFLGAGYTHEKGPYTEQMKRAIDWLISQQLPNGYLGGNATRYDQNYCHAIATFALAEAYAVQNDAADFPALRDAVKRGIKMISVLQNEDGGWRYGKGGESSESDMSMFGWQLMALKSAVNAGIPVPEETRRGMVKFLEARGRGKFGGLAGYRTADRPTPAMTAEALYCRQMFAIRPNDEASQEAVQYLKENLPRVTAYDEYYWYYGTLALHNQDDEAWQQWNASLRDMLVSLQRHDGPLSGSWDPRGKWAGIGGRLYSTALSTMCLEVYYRYSLGSKTEEEPK